VQCLQPVDVLLHPGPYRWSYGTGYGQSLGGFLNYVLTIGEKQASSIDYSSIGLSLEQFGISQAQNIPGYLR